MCAEKQDDPVVTQETNPIAEDVSKKVSDTQHSMDDSIRAAWVTGSRCEIFSHQAKQWLPGQVRRLFDDDEGEWLDVMYTVEHINQSKQVQRDSPDIRPHVE